MANSAGSRKRARQTVKRNRHNSQLKTRLRTFIKKTIAAINSKEKELATKSLQTLQRVIDQASSKRLIHKNAAARKKSRLAAKIKTL